MEIWVLVSIAVAIFLGVVGALILRRRQRDVDRVEAPPAPELPSPKAEATILAEPTPEVPSGVAAVPAPSEPVATIGAPPLSLSDRLSRTRGSLVGKLGRVLGMIGKDLPPAEWDNVEEALIEGDVGVATTQLLLSRIRDRIKESGGQSGMRDLVRQESEALLSGLSHGMAASSTWPKPYVISVVGVNGAGKTTTIGKLASELTRSGKSVLLGAGDTFRAAAISQLKVWADRSKAQFVTGREGGDPGAVAFDSVTAAKARGMDVVIIDTAGRLHTKTDLMEELKKVHRVIKKVIPEAPHETWLVLDGTAGQNSVQQAREFQKALDLTGVVVTKLDGTAKGGAILAIAAELKLPIKFIGVGEGIDDLIPFEPKPFVDAILG